MESHGGQPDLLAVCRCGALGPEPSYVVSLFARGSDADPEAQLAQIVGLVEAQGDRWPGKWRMTSCDRTRKRCCAEALRKQRCKVLV